MRHFPSLTHSPNNALCHIVFPTSYVVYTPVLSPTLSPFFILTILSTRCILHLISRESHFSHCASCTLPHFLDLPPPLVSIVILCDARTFLASLWNLSSGAICPLRDRPIPRPHQTRLLLDFTVHSSVYLLSLFLYFITSLI